MLLSPSSADDAAETVGLLRRAAWHTRVLVWLEMSGSGVVVGHMLAFQDAGDRLGFGNWCRVSEGFEVKKEQLLQRKA